MKKKPILLFTIFLLFVSCNEEPEIIHVSGITLYYSTVTLVIGETCLLEVTVSPDNAEDKSIQWSSSVPEVATVKDGLIEAISEGETRIMAETRDGGFIARCLVIVKPPFIVVEGQKCVDLGLSVKWAYYNLGASTPEEFGEFYAWGEVTPKDVYNYDNYKYWGVTGNSQEGTTSYTYYGFTKYCTSNRSDKERYDIIDGKTTLDLSDDAVNYKYGGKWRMPTYNEWNELHTSCTWRWTTVNNVEGYLIIGKNGNKLFLPNAGQVFGETYYTEWTKYWTSSLDLTAPRNSYAYSSWCMNWRHLMSKGEGWDERYYGHTIRGVIK